MKEDIESKLIEIVREVNNKKMIDTEIDNLLLHSKKVKEISVEIANEINIVGRDLDLIIAGALLHDIKKHTGDKHNKLGAEYIESNISHIFQCIDKNEEELIILMVRCHKCKNYKEKKYNAKQIRMIEIVRASDKIAKLCKAKNKVQEKTIKKIIEQINNLIDEDVRKIAKEMFEKQLNLIDSNLDKKDN